MSDNRDYRSLLSFYWDWPEINPLIWLTFCKSNWDYEPKKTSDNNLELKGSVMASDAFFPFPDCIKLAADEGVAGIIQPGGSIKDNEIIEEVNKQGMFMIFTKTRHFYH